LSHPSFRRHRSICSSLHSCLSSSHHLSFGCDVSCRGCGVLCRGYGVMCKVMWIVMISRSQSGLKTSKQKPNLDRLVTLTSLFMGPGTCRDEINNKQIVKVPEQSERAFFFFLAVKGRKRFSQMDEVHLIMFFLIFVIPVIQFMSKCLPTQ